MSISRRPTAAPRRPSSGSVMIGVIRCGTPSYVVSSTRLGSTRIIRTSSGVDRISTDVISELMQARLAGAGGPGDQQVRHLGQVGDDEAALDVLAERPRSSGVGRCSPLDRSTSPRNTISVSALGISTPTAVLPGIGLRIRASAPTAPSKRCCATPRIFSTLTPVPLDLVTGDGRASGVAGDLRVDAELVEHLGQLLHDGIAGLRPRQVRRAGLEGVAVRQRVGDVAGQRELLDPLRQRACAAAARARRSRPGRRRRRARRRARRRSARGAPSTPPPQPRRLPCGRVASWWAPRAAGSRRPGRP